MLPLSDVTDNSLDLLYIISLLLTIDRKRSAVEIPEVTQNHSWLLFVAHIGRLQRPTCCREHYCNNFDMKWNSILIDMQHGNFGSLGTVQFQQCAATRLPMREHIRSFPQVYPSIQELSPRDSYKWKPASASLSTVYSAPFTYLC